MPYSRTQSSRVGWQTSWLNSHRPLVRSTVPGPDTGTVILHIEYADMAAYGARTAFENGNAEWRALFASQPNSPETLLSVQLLTELTP